MMPTFVTLASQTSQNIPSTVLVFLIVATVLYGAGAILVPETQGNMDKVAEA